MHAIYSSKQAVFFIIRIVKQANTISFILLQDIIFP
jgi:hypothetical protein